MVTWIWVNIGPCHDLLPDSTNTSHYLMQCWLCVSEVLWHTPECISQWVPKLLSCMMSLKIILLELLSHLSRGSELMCQYRMFSFIAIPVDALTLNDTKTAECGQASSRHIGDHTELTHLPRDKVAAISQTIFSNAFSWMKNFVFWIKFHWSMFLRVQLTIAQHWFRYWLGAE